MPDGSEWEVPASVVADNRAHYYADRDEDTTYDEEFEFAMSDSSEIKDWASNNMEWNDVKEHAKQVIPPEKPDFREGWLNGKKEIVW